MVPRENDTTGLVLINDLFAVGYLSMIFTTKSTEGHTNNIQGEDNMLSDMTLLIIPYPCKIIKLRNENII